MSSSSNLWRHHFIVRRQQRDDNAQFGAGYRALYQDYSDGSGANKFEWDVTLHGPVFALGTEF